MNNTIIVIIVWLLLSFVFMVVVFIRISKKTKENLAKFKYHWNSIENSMKREGLITFNEVAFHTEKLLWNPNMRKHNFEEIILYLKNNKYADDSKKTLKLIDTLYDKRGWNA